MPTVILLLTQTRLSIHQANRNTAKLLADLSLDETELSTLQTLARQWHRASFHVLVDWAEEDFHVESVPRLSGADQRALCARKLDHSYHSTPYRRIAVNQGQREGQNTLMLSALTRREPLDRIIDTLLAEKCAIAGIHSVALACGELLRIDQPHLLLFSHVEPGYWRQSYFTAQGLRFSRLGNLLPDADKAIHGVHLAEEAHRTHQYLSHLHALNRHDPLDVLLLTDAEDPVQLADSFKQTLHEQIPHIHARVGTVNTLASMLGFPDKCMRWETLLLLAIARGQVKDHYLPAAAGHYHRLRQLGRALNWTAALILLAGALLGWKNHAETLHLQSTMRQTHRALQIAAADQQEVSAQIRSLRGSQPEAMKDAVELDRKYLANWPDVEDTAQTISQILANYPLLTIAHFSWKALPGTQIPIPASRNISIPETITRRGQIIEIAGYIDAFNGNFRAALGQIDQLQAQLEKMPRTTTILQNAPLDIRPQGSISSPENDMVQAKFALQIVIAPKNEGGK
ncbi:MAG: hypothetical protein P4L87_13035 [Formivibrio sp.]|nr:hypothetical protein [Formivibrio sp.]